MLSFGHPAIALPQGHEILARPIPVVLNPTENGLTLSLEATAAVVGLTKHAPHANWATCPPDRTCVRLQPHDAPDKAVVYQIFARGELFLTRAGESQLSLGSAGSGAFQIEVTSLAETVHLSLRPTVAPRIALREGYGEVTKGLGSTNEGPLEGEITYDGDDAGKSLVLKLHWRGTRLFGLVGGKSRTLRIPVRNLMTARWTRKATLDGNRARLSDAHLIELTWKVPPNAKARANRRSFSVASARLIAKITPEARAQLGLLDFLAQQRMGTVKHDCCYPDSSLSAYLRFNRASEPGADRCDTSHRCTKEEREWFQRSP